MPALCSQKDSIEDGSWKSLTSTSAELRPWSTPDFFNNLTWVTFSWARFLKQNSVSKVAKPGPTFELRSGNASSGTEFCFKNLPLGPMLTTARLFQPGPERALTRARSWARPRPRIRGGRRFEAARGSAPPPGSCRTRSRARGRRRRRRSSRTTPTSIHRRRLRRRWAFIRAVVKLSLHQ
jgi:hypothetical protein